MDLANGIECPGMHYYEYKIIHIKTNLDADIEDILNENGKLGWECFNIIDKKYYFKRKRLVPFL